MSADATSQLVARQALYEMQRYLADEIPPLMAVDAANILLRMPPQHGANAIRLWVESQLNAPDRAVTVGSYLYHAVKKFHLFCEFELVDRLSMDRYLSELSRLVLELCPEREQAELHRGLNRLGKARTTLSAPVNLLNRELGTPEEERLLKRAVEHQQQQPVPPQGQAARIIPASPRLAMMIGRLGELHGQAPGGAEPCPGVRSEELLAGLVTKAAVEARDAAQFHGTLQNLKDKGIEPKFDWMFRMLGQRLPGWTVDLSQAPPDVVPVLGRPLEAMQRIVSFAQSKEDGIERLNAMVYAAIEQFNEGHLAQAVAMFDLAARLIEENKVNRELAETIRLRAQDSVSLGPMRKFSSAPAKHGLLRKVLRFFPAFSPDELLKRLDGEPKRDVRKLILSLLEVHGPPCRGKVLERLIGYRSGDLPDPGGFYSRNIVFLLRRIPRHPDDDPQEERELLAEFSRPGRPFMITKEAVGALADLNIPQAEQTLLDRLLGFEREIQRGSGTYDWEELLEMLDRICAALARMGTPRAVAGLIDHAFRSEPALGDTAGRVAHLSAIDLSDHPQQLERLLGSLRAMLPAKILGVVVGRRGRQVSNLVRALSGTRQDSVRAVFAEIVERFPGQEFAEQTREALARFQSGPEPEVKGPEALSGDVELFGLPALLQSLADSEATGRLVIVDPHGRDRAAVFLADGKIVHCGTGRLTGIDALGQLFERPEPGTFRFEQGDAGAAGLRGAEPLEVLPTVLELMRRHDEFQEDRALVPDGASLMAGDVAPSRPDDEDDTNFVSEVWREATSGTAPESCEGALGADAYRVRRLYAHWLERGALKLRPAA